MTVAAGHVTAGRPAPAAPPADAPGPAEPPRLADGVELLGEYQDSGYSQPPSLVRRADGQVIQMSPLLYRVTSPDRRLPRPRRHRGAGQRRPRPVTERRPGPLSHHGQAAAPRHRRRQERPGRPAAGQPAARAQGAGHAAARTRGERRRDAAPAAVPVAGDRGRGRQRRGRGLLAVRRPWAGPGASADPARPGGPAHRARPVRGSPPRSTSAGTRPGCRYGGARPGVVGVGIYLVWPSFFTNVTDSYRLSRAGRLRTDLGGLYFNLIFMLALAGIYAATSAEVLLLVIAVTHLEMLEQLLPFVRFDGYFILSDLVGVPDLFARVAPILRSAVTRGAPGPARHRPAAPRPDRGDRLGGVRHPAAHARPRVPAAVLPRRSTGRCGAPRAGRRTSWPPRSPGTTTRRPRSMPSASPCWPVARRLAVHRGRAGAAAHRRGPALVRRPSRAAASWSPRPAWRA